MMLLIALLCILVLFMMALLGGAVALRVKYGDSSAAYPLFALRDRAIGAVVFGGVRRDDPWFEFLYRRINALLMLSNLAKGPERGWARARWAGRHFAQDLDDHRRVEQIPQSPPPVELQPILKDLERSLGNLEDRHMGVRIFWSEARREANRRRLEEAKAVRHAVERSAAIAT